MKISEQEIESLLRQAPQPKPKPGLKRQLLAQVKLPTAPAHSPSAVTAAMSGGWFRRWWPALATATVSLVCALVLAVQQSEIRDLRASLQALSEATPTIQPPSNQTTPRTPSAETSAIEASAKEQQEISRLKRLASQLAGEMAQLEQLAKENERLRSQLATPPGLTADEVDALNKARERAMAITCVNNLKQLGLAARQWALDNGDLYPTGILSMTNEMNTPKILVCPADTNRPPAANWSVFTAVNCSYEYLAPGGNPKESTRVLFSCPTHGSIGLCDGSVQMGVARNHPEWLVQRNGKLYYESKPRSPKP